MESTVSNKSCDVVLHSQNWLLLWKTFEIRHCTCLQIAFIYKTRLEQLGADVEGWMHTSRLKERLLSVLPDFQAHSQGKCIILTFDEDIGSVLWKACNIDDDSMHLARTAQVMRKEMFEKN